MSSFKSERELNTRFCANSPNAQYQINEDGSSQMYDFTAPPQQSFNSPETVSYPHLIWEGASNPVVSRL